MEASHFSIDCVSKVVLTPVFQLVLWLVGAAPDDVVTGALGRKTDSKIATAPKTQSRSKDQIKINIIQSRIKR